VGTPRTSWEDVVLGYTLQILETRRWRRRAEDRRTEASSEGGQGPGRAVAPLMDGITMHFRLVIESINYCT